MKLLSGLDSLRREYDSKGYIKIEGLFSPSEMDEIDNEMTGFIQKVAPTLSGKEINYSDKQINSIHCVSQKSPYFDNLMRKSELTQIVSTLLNDDADPRYMEYFAKPALIGLPSPMHQDNYYWSIAGGNGLTIWIALDDCDESNGGVTYYEGTHKLGLIEHEASYAPGSSQKVKDSIIEKLTSQGVKTELFPLRRGDAQIHHSMVVHGSGPNKSKKSRRGLTIQYKGLHSEYDLEHRAKYEASLKAQLEARGQ
jgi:phytanoyl-CoA hydroxylase